MIAIVISNIPECVCVGGVSEGGHCLEHGEMFSGLSLQRECAPSHRKGDVYNLFPLKASVPRRLFVCAVAGSGTKWRFSPIGFSISIHFHG